MNLHKNPNWHINAKQYFNTNEEININNKNIKIDYTIKDIKDQIVVYGFDLPENNLNVKDIPKFLFEDKELNNEDSLMNRMFKLYNHENNPIIFLATNKCIFYMPNGIRQMNFNFWQETDDINVFIKILDEKNNKILGEEEKVKMHSNENKNIITLEELKQIYNLNQIVTLTKKPFWFEEFVKEEIHSTKENQINSIIKYRTNRIKRLCILDPKIGNNLKIKVEYQHDSELIDTWGQEFSTHTSCYYFLIDESGNIKEIKYNKDGNEEYRNFNIEF